MGDDFKELKSVLRSLVVSSPTQMDVRTLLRDYRNIVGEPLPLAKYGHRDPVAFLKERFGDCFLFGAQPSNPVLTLIVPDTLKHIDKFVQKQKIPSTAKIKSKRRSIPETSVNPPQQNLIYKTCHLGTSVPTVIEEQKKLEVKVPDVTYNTKNINHTLHNSNINYTNHNTDSTNHISSTNNDKENYDNQNKPVTSNDVKNFLMKRVPMYNFQETDPEKVGAFSVSQDDDSGKHTSSSNNSTKALQFEELKSEIMELITTAPHGVWCTDLISLYRERYNRELNFMLFGYTSIISLVYVLEPSVQITRPDETGDWLLQDRRRAAAAPPALRPRRAAPARAAPPRPVDPDDALPGIDFDPDVFPDDCLNFMESIPSMSLADFRPGAMVEVIVGEVYSPSHFWLIRLGENYNIAMEDLMDEMTLYYNAEGRDRVLARGAIRVGQYCSSLYDKDWHRSLIVKIIDCDTVKVRHVDYGTVDTVECAALRPLRHCWAQLPAQAVRARLGGVRPSAAGRRWPHAAAAHFLRAVRDMRLVANVVAVDPEEGLVETLLIDTSGAEDVCLSGELIRAGHADARPDSALRAVECYLYPRFEALENGDTPNFGEIHAYLRDGITLDYVEAYRLHVPLSLPPDCPARAPSPAPPSLSPAPPSQSPAPLSQSPAPLSQSSVPPSPAPGPPSPPPGPPAPPSSEPPSPATRIPLLWPGDAAAPAAPRPAPPRAEPGACFPGLVLSAAECVTYFRLAHSDPAAAYWYMVGTISRAMRVPHAPYASMHPPHASLNPAHTFMHPPNPYVQPPHPYIYPPHPSMHPPHTSMHLPHPSMHPPSVSIRPPPGFGG